MLLKEQKADAKTSNRMMDDAGVRSEKTSRKDKPFP